MKRWLAWIDEGRLKAEYWGISLLRDLRGVLSTKRRTESVPTDVNIEPSNLCNANCVFCGYQFQTRAHRPVPQSLAFEVIDAARNSSVKRLGLTPTVGEPLVNRELESIIRYAKRPPRPLAVGLTTNGLLLNAERYLSLVEAGLDDLNISMTYPDDEEYERIYRNRGLKILVRNLEGVLEVHRRGACRVSISVRTCRRTWDHPLFERARRAGWSVERNSFFDDWSGTVTAGLREHGFLIRPLRARRLPCMMLFSGPHILSDGRATACGCRDLDGKSQLALDSDALLADLKGAYNGRPIEALRNRFRDGDPPDVCITCRHYNPQFAGETLRVRISQLIGDVAAMVGRERRPRRHASLPLVQ
jgi:hypothetical protein